MPRRDGTGNAGQVPGRGAGRSMGRGRAAGPLGSDVCTCTKCGHQEPHNQRGVPCTQLKCPKCEGAMKGEFC